jgi:hypothetical protein
VEARRSGRGDEREDGSNNLHGDVIEER